MKRIKGIGVSEGIAIGKAFLYRLKEEKTDINEKDTIPYEDKKTILQKYIEKTKNELEKIYKSTLKTAKNEAGIFQAQILFLEDPAITTRIDSLMKQGFSIKAAVKRAFEENALNLEKMENPYFKERAKDVRDVEKRLLKNIANEKTQNLSALPYKAIVVAKDLTPSDTASLDKENVLGFVTEAGGITSHTAILAEALGIPAVVGAKGITKEVQDETLLIIDGESGEIIINPDKKTINRFEDERKKKLLEKKRLEETKFLSATTKTGKRIEVSANIGKVEDANIALQEGADGVGLFRTEFLFLDRTSAPSEEEQFEAYKTVLQTFKEKPVIIRTLDIGGDKQIPYLDLEKELNPFLGVRAIRLCLKKVDLFRTQLKAILRASIYGNVKIMYPMIAVKEEIEKANSILSEVKNELRERHIPFKNNIEVGIMVEIPSAALNAEELIDYVDFFSIGTNDLIQYTFAADRTNKNVSYLYNPTHPAILKLIKMTIEASHSRGKWTGMCGEMAGDVNAIPKLIEMGIDELSMSAQKIPRAKEIIRSL